MIQGKRLEDDASAATKYGAVQSTLSRAAEIWWLPFALIVVSALFARFIALAIPPLLDEQFFLTWTSHLGAAAAPPAEYFGWKGFAETDLWGPLTPLLYALGQVIVGGVPSLIRFEALCLNAVTASLLFVALRRLFPLSFWLPLVSAILFCLFPFNAETVSWFGGRGAELTGFFFVASLVAYQQARGLKSLAVMDSSASNSSASSSFALNSSALNSSAVTNSTVAMNSALDASMSVATNIPTGLSWPWMMGSLALFICALLCSANIWVGCLFFPFYEFILWDGTRKSVDGRHHDSSSFSAMFIGPLLFIVATACIVAGTGSLLRLLGDAAPQLSFMTLYKTLRAMVFPINEAIWHGYARQFRILYFLLTPFAVMFILALRNGARLRQQVLFLTVWFAIMFLPQVGHIAVGADMFGSRLLYLASMPFCGLMAAIFLSPLFVFKRKPMIGFGVSLVGLLVLAGVYAAHGWNQDAAYRNGGRLLHNVQKSIAIVHGKTQAPYVLVRDVPPYVAASPMFSTDGLVVFDGGTGLLSARNVSAGHLKDDLRAGKYTDVTFTWDPNMRALLPLDLSAMPTVFPEKMTAAAIVNRFLPSLEFYKQAKFDAVANEITLDSNSTSGPAIRLTVDGLGPLSADFIYVDAKIDAPVTGKRPLVEMYWLTPFHQNYDERLRRTYATAIVGDGKIHRYYLSLDSIGFTTSGAISNITLGFPAGAKVVLIGMGLLPKDKLVPTFDVDQATIPQPVVSGYDSPFVRYPNVPDLGLYVLPEEAQSLPVSYGVSNLPGAVGVSVEVSMPYKDFPNPNGTEYSGVGFKTVAAVSSDGHFAVPLTDLPGPGIYALRAVAVNAGHNPISAFSDAVYVLVRTHRRLASGEQG